MLTFHGVPVAATPVIAGVIVLLVIIIVGIAIRVKGKSKMTGPAGGPPASGPAAACQAFADPEQQQLCVNAVSACMPLAGVRAATSPGGASRVLSTHLPACVAAVTRLNPQATAAVAKQMGGPKACLPSQASNPLALVTTAQNTLREITPLVSWGGQVASFLPVCPGAGSGALPGAADAPEAFTSNSRATIPLERRGREMRDYRPVGPGTTSRYQTGTQLMV